MLSLPESVLTSTFTSFICPGHSIVPATIPKGTVLYHGRMNNLVPDVPEWFAFDFEHAYLFCVSPCYVISVQAKQDLRLLYFDGSSAAKMDDGPMESQDIVAWGKPRPDKFSAERERIDTLCEWGNSYGLDGFIRMEFHLCAFQMVECIVLLKLIIVFYSEAMICDVSGSLEVITHLELLPKNVTEWNRRPHRTPFPPPPYVEPPPGWLGSLPGFIRGGFEAHVAGGWHDLAPGETRIQLDYTGFVTFYDPTLSSLVDARLGKDRMHHRIEKISPADAARIHVELRSVLTRKQDNWSSVDWRSIVHIVTERYAGRLEYLRFLLSSNASVTFMDAAEQAFAARAQLLVMLGPYITTVDVPQMPVSANVSWLAPVVRRCATTLTSSIPLGMLTPQEVRIHAAVENTLREICRRLALLWAEFFDVEGADEAKAAEVIEVGHGHIDELMSWLDWSVWVRCEPSCGLGVRQQ